MATGSARDPSPAHIARLTPSIQSQVVRFINAARAAGVPLVVTSSVRTAAEQRQLVAMGRSNTLASKHLSGRAFDVDVYGVDRNALPASFWNWLGPLGESYGFSWGGRWRSPYDPGHFEL